MRRNGAAALILLLIGGACTWGGGSPPGSTVRMAAAALERFEDCDELLSRIRTQALDIVGPYGLPETRGHVIGDVATAVPERTTAQTDAAPVPADFSGTNVQEAGVDEPDLVKTDGGRVLALAQGRLHHVSSPDGEPQLTGSIALPDGWGHNMLLAADRALVFLTPQQEMRAVPDTGDFIGIPSMEARTLVAVVDIADPEAMSIAATLEFDGSYVSARYTGGVVRLVVRSHGTALPFTYPEDGGPAAERRAELHNRGLVATSTVADWLPTYVLEDAEGTSEGPLAGCEDTYYPEEFSGTGLVSVVTIDPADPTPRDTASVLADAQVVYASHDNLYVAMTRWNPGPIGLREPVAVDPDEPVSSDAAPEPATTDIHTFDISDPRRAVYVGAGAVEGSVLDQWSLSEHDGHLRVATTVDEWDAERSESFVTVLERQGDELVEIGQVGDLGRGERIYAVRFMGATAYVVTFRQIDPLYVLDLHNPQRPEVLGELKIPGYSAYLHPVGDGLLLGVGQDATDEGMPLGTQVSLFDVSDPQRPERLHNLFIEGANSEVEYDHLAFLWWAPASLAVLPLHIWDHELRVVEGNEPSEPTEPFAGVLALRVGGDGVEEVTRLSHPARTPPPGQDDVFVGPTPIRRSLVVGETLYTYSEAGLLASDLETFEERAWVPFR